MISAVGQLAGKVVIPLIVGLFVANGITLEKVNNKIQENKNLYQIEIEELIDDYLDYETDYVEYTVNDMDEEIDENMLNEIKGDALDSYTNNQKYENVDISERTFDYMYKQLPDGAKRSIDYNKKYGMRGINEKIVWYYIKYKVFDDDFNWLRR